MSSFLGLVWPWENLPRSLSVGPPPIGYSSSLMESLWMPPASQTYLCQCCLSHICVVFCSKEVSLCRPSQRILSFISWPFPVSSWFAIVPVSVWCSFLHLVRGRRPQLDLNISDIFVTSLGCVLYHLSHRLWYRRVSHTFYFAAWIHCVLFVAMTLFTLSWIRIVHFGGHVHTEHGYARLRIYVRI